MYTTKLEDKLITTTMLEAKQSGGAYFITTKGKPGTLPGRKDHADIMHGLTEDSESDNLSDFSVTPSLNEFLKETKWIRIRFVSDTANMTIRTIPNKNQIKALEELPNIVSEIEFDFGFENITCKSETATFDNLIKTVKQIKEENESHGVNKI